MQGLFESGWFQLTVKIILSVIIVLVLALVCGLIIPRLQRRFRVRLQRDHTIQLKNQGNVSSIFHLTAESVEPLLNFRFFHDGAPLSEILVSEDPPTASIQLPASHQEKPQRSETSTTSGRAIPARMSADKMATLNAAKQSGEKVIAKTGAAASLLGVLGSLLPGDLGKSIKEQGNAVRGLQTKTKDVMDKPQAMQRKLDQVQKDSGKLGVKTPTPQFSSGFQEPSAETAQPDRGKPAREKSSAKPQDIRKEVIKYYCTSEVLPGETIELTLQVGSKKRTKPEGSYWYTIKSRQVPLEKIEKKVPSITRQGMVSFTHANKLKYFLADLICVLFALAGLLTTLFGISLVW